MKGIDISNNDGNVDFQVVKNQGYEIVYIKATEGLTYNDPLMKEYYNGCKNVGLKIGFYHFLRKNDPIQEAIHFISSIQGLNYDCLPMIDVEHDSLKDGSASWRVKQFADYCKSQGIQVGLYTYTSFIKEAMNRDNLGLPLWIAEYGVSDPHINIDNVGFQYSETGQVSGIDTNCDLDEFDEGILISGGMNKLENIVVYHRGADEHSAEILADFLNCPTIAADRTFDFLCVKNVIGVGGIADQYTSYLTKLISGGDRYSTNQAVLDFIKNGGR